MSRFGLRSRLTLALAAVVVVAVGVVTVLGDRGLHAQLSQTARDRLEHSATHFAAVAAVLYADAGNWDRIQPTLVHLAAFNNLLAQVETENGRVLRLTPPPSVQHAQAPIVVDGRRVATVTVSPAGGELFTPEEQQLHRSLDRLHVVAGSVAIAAALAIGLLLAETMTRPLRRLRQTAEHMERGALDVRVDPSGGKEVVALGRALNKLAQTLQHEEEVRKATAADLSHELRTPVNSLLARIEAAQDGVLPAADNLASMHTEALRLTRLLDDISRLADAERPGLLVEKRLVDLGEIALSVADSFAPRFQGTRVALTADVGPIWAWGDAGRLEEVIDNLLSNAFRYTEKGTVRIGVGRQGNEALLEVEDTGIGIAPEDLRNVFTRFWRGDRSRSRATGGSGIGLAIVREIVRAHDGRVEVESTPSRGSTFRVFLPLAPAPPRAPVRMAAKAPAVG